MGFGTVFVRAYVFAGLQNEENRMSRATWLTQAVLVAACAIAVSIASAEAQTKRKKPVQRTGQQTLEQSHNAVRPYISNRYNMPPGGGINFNDPGRGANYYGSGGG